MLLSELYQDKPGYLYNSVFILNPPCCVLSLLRHYTAALAEALKTNTTLTALELNNNNIDYEGTTAISEVKRWRRRCAAG